MAFQRGVPGAPDRWPRSLRGEPEILTQPICHVIMPCRWCHCEPPLPGLQTGAIPAPLALLLQLKLRCEFWKETGVYYV